jgi:hypothetical protein
MMPLGPLLVGSYPRRWGLIVERSMMRHQARTFVSSEAETGWRVEGIPPTVAHRGFVPARMDEAENPRGIRKLEPEGL